MNHGGAVAGVMRQEAEPAKRSSAALHPAWQSFMRYCAELRFGDIERLRIQDGLPVLAEETRKKVRFVE
jgi:hypothetical protein